MPRYIVPHHGGLKYVRAVPRDIQRVEGRKVWTAYFSIKEFTPADAKTRALELAAQHDRRAKALRSLPDTDKRLLISKGGLVRCEADSSQADYLAAVLYPYTFDKRRGETTKRTIAGFLEAQAPIHYIVAKASGKPTEQPPRGLGREVGAHHRPRIRGQSDQWQARARPAPSIRRHAQSCCASRG